MNSQVLFLCAKKQVPTRRILVSSRSVLYPHRIYIQRFKLKSSVPRTLATETSKVKLFGWFFFIIYKEPGLFRAVKIHVSRDCEDDVHASVT